MNENIVDKRVYKTLTKIENGMIRLLEDKPYKDINAVSYTHLTLPTNREV